MIIFTVSTCCAVEPVFKTGPLPAGKTNTLQSFTVWLYSEGEWELRITGNERFRHRLEGDENWLQHHAPLSGGGSGEPLVFRWEVGFDSQWLAPGVYEYPLALELTGAHGILRAPSKTGYWIMPLNTDGVFLQRPNEVVSIGNYTWTLVEPGDGVYYNNQLLFDSVQLSEHKSWLQPEGSSLRWENTWLSLEAGERLSAVLILEGPVPPGELIIEKPTYAVFDEVWYLNETVMFPQQLEDKLVFKIPELGHGSHRLCGTISGLLAPKDWEEEISAFYGDCKASLVAAVRRTWFDRLGQLELRVLYGTDPASQVPFLFPDGEVRFTDENGILRARLAPGLQVIYCLHQPEKPLWVVSHPNGFQTLTIDLHSYERPNDFIIPSIRWGENGYWGILGKLGTWNFHIGSEKRIINGQIGALRFQGDEEQMGLWYSSQTSTAWEDGHWRWRQSNQGIHGLWSQSGWVFSVAVPWQKDKVSAAHLSFYQDGWYMQIDPHDFRLSYSQPSWTVGASLRAKTFWAQVFERRVRLELQPHKINVGWFEPNSQWIVDYVPSEKLRLEYKSNRYEFSAERTQDGSKRGLRASIPYSLGNMDFSTGSALLMENNGFMGELRHQAWWDICPQLQLFATGSLQCTLWEKQTSSLFVDYGLGVHITPLPTLSGMLAWEKSSGWKWQIGMAVPFVAGYE